MIPIQDNISYSVRLKNKEVIKAIFYRYYRAPIFTEPSIYEPEALSFIPSYTEHEDCFVFGSRIINIKEIDSILIDNIWYLLVE